MEKILSVIIPSYNSSAFLEKCLSSVTGEDIIDDIEVIVVNDGSTDGCEKIAERYIEKYPDSVILINKENGGHGSALNAGTKRATAKYIKALDADDWFLSDNMKVFIDKLKTASADVILTPYHTINISDGEIKAWRCYPESFDREYTLDDVMADWKAFDRGLTFHGITYRGDFYKEYGTELIEGVFYEDHQFSTYPACYAKSILPIDLFIYEYRIGDVTQSVSAENQLKRLPHTEAVLKAMSDGKKAVTTDIGKSFVTKKTHILLLSYLVTALLCNKNKKLGREQAKAMMDWFYENDKAVADISKKHYSILRKMNRLHISDRTYRKMLNSKLYKKLRHSKSFD